MPYADLVQEGWLGVLQATTTFDPAKGPYFSTHAQWVARKAILDVLTARSRLIRLPAAVVVALRQITAAQQQWAQTSDRPPTVGDLARLTGLAPPGCSRLSRWESGGSPWTRRGRGLPRLASRSGHSRHEP